MNEDSAVHLPVSNTPAASWGADAAYRRTIRIGSDGSLVAATGSLCDGRVPRVAERLKRVPLQQEDRICKLIPSSFARA